MTVNNNKPFISEETVAHGVGETVSTVFGRFAAEGVSSLVAAGPAGLLNVAADGCFRVLIGLPLQRGLEEGIKYYKRRSKKNISAEELSFAANMTAQGASKLATFFVVAALVMLICNKWFGTDYSYGDSLKIQGMIFGMTTATSLLISLYRNRDKIKKKYNDMQSAFTFVQKQIKSTQNTVDSAVDNALKLPIGSIPGMQNAHGTRQEVAKQFLNLTLANVCKNQSTLVDLAIENMDDRGDTPLAQFLDPAIINEIHEHINSASHLERALSPDSPLNQVLPEIAITAIKSGIIDTFKKNGVQGLVKAGKQTFGHIATRAQAAVEAAKEQVSIVFGHAAATAITTATTPTTGQQLPHKVSDITLDKILESTFAEIEGIVAPD